jgi:acetyl-CoA carboxylase carboxyl transferase subunit beta
MVLDATRGIDRVADRRREAGMAEPKHAIGDTLPDAGDDLFELPCPGCGASLSGSARFEVFRVCGGCGRHFPLPARERLALLLDPDAFSETNAALLSLDPVLFHDQLPFQDRLAEAQELLAPPGLAEGAVTGVGLIEGRAAVLIVLDLAALGGTIGVLAGEKITLAIEQATADRLPVIAICTGGRGPERAHEGILALHQLAKIANAGADHRRAGLALIAILAHPTTGGVYVGLANQADVILAEPGARLGLTLAADQGAPAATGDRLASTSETLLAHGHVDAVVARDRVRQVISTILSVIAARGPARCDGMTGDPGSPIPAPSWEVGTLARHPARPSARDLLDGLLSDFVELHGDRSGDDDPAVVAGLGHLAGQGVAIVAQDRRAGGEGGAAAGRMRAAGYRKADRVMRLAGRLELPIVVLIDAAGPTTGPEADVDGIGVALGQALGRSSLLPVPLVTAIVGWADGLGALALGTGDRTLMLEHAVYAVPGADGSSGADRPADRVAPRGGRLVSARECLRLGVVDRVVPEPGAGAHTDPTSAAHLLRGALAEALAELTSLGSRRLVAERGRRLRTLGTTTPEARAATHGEAIALLELHDLPRHLARSLGEWRERLESRYRDAARRGRPQLHLSRPELANRIAALRANVAGAVARSPLGAENAPTAVLERDPPAEPETRLADAAATPRSRPPD